MNLAEVPFPLRVKIADALIEAGDSDNHSAFTERARQLYNTCTMPPCISYDPSHYEETSRSLYHIVDPFYFFASWIVRRGETYHLGPLRSDYLLQALATEEPTERCRELFRVALPPSGYMSTARAVSNLMMANYRHIEYFDSWVSHRPSSHEVRHYHLANVERLAVFGGHRVKYLIDKLLSKRFVSRKWYTDVLARIGAMHMLHGRVQDCSRLWARCIDMTSRLRCYEDEDRSSDVLLIHMESLEGLESAQSPQNTHKLIRTAFHVASSDCSSSSQCSQCTSEVAECTVDATVMLVKSARCRLHILTDVMLYSKCETAFMRLAHCTFDSAMAGNSCENDITVLDVVRTTKRLGNAYEQFHKYQKDKSSLTKVIKMLYTKISISELAATRLGAEELLLMIFWSFKCCLVDNFNDPFFFRLIDALLCKCSHVDRRSLCHYPSFFDFVRTFEKRSRSRRPTNAGCRCEEVTCPDLRCWAASAVVYVPRHMADLRFGFGRRGVTLLRFVESHKNLKRDRVVRRCLQIEMIDRGIDRLRSTVDAVLGIFERTNMLY